MGSSSVKAALLNAAGVNRLSAACCEMSIRSYRTGSSKQDPKPCWRESIKSIPFLQKKFPFKKDEICATGISYQMLI
jgi:sugar (pentulose or hexulose) kinase